MLTYKDINFVLVGPGNTGSTWLRDMLSSIPGVSIPPETNYLTWLRKKGHSLTDLYSDLSSIDTLVLGEHANSYFAHPNGARVVFEENRDIKIVVMVRDPLTVVEKHYRHDRRWGQYPAFWTLQVACEPDAFYERYIGAASYQRNLKRWLELFPAAQFFLFNGDAKGQQRQDIFAALTSFLKLPPVIPASFEKRSNVSIFTPFPRLHRYAKFGRNPKLKKLAHWFDYANVWAAKFIAEPAFTSADREVVLEALSDEQSLDRLRQLAREHQIAGSEWL